jgi:hypothetical protein
MPPAASASRSHRPHRDWRTPPPERHDDIASPQGGQWGLRRRHRNERFSRIAAMRGSSDAVPKRSWSLANIPSFVEAIASLSIAIAWRIGISGGGPTAVRLKWQATGLNPRTQLQSERYSNGVEPARLPKVPPPRCAGVRSKSRGRVE